MGISDEDFYKTRQIMLLIPDLQFILIDVANGYTETFVNTVKEVRKFFPNVILIAGNVCTGEMTEELILAGTDIVKAGISGGSSCVTRKQTGVGYPQLSCVIECADAAHGLGGFIMSDGGCCNPGDVAKAFGAGADFVMLGGMLSAHEESGGELIEKLELNPKTGEKVLKKYKEFYGMSSNKAMEKYKGEKSEYVYRSSEGRETLLPYRGPIKETIQDILGGLRSACTYIGAKTLKEVSKRTTFIMVTQQLNQVYQNFTN
jgi:GMP reductase